MFLEGLNENFGKDVRLSHNLSRSMLVFNLVC
jgi:hypothetical protein